MKIAAIGGSITYQPSGTSQKTTTAGSSSNTTRIYDKKDLNKDGVVTAEEEIEYAILHSEGTGKNETAGVSSQGYNQQGEMINSTSGAQSILDIYI